MKNRYKTASDFVSTVETLYTLPDVYLKVKNVVEDPDSCLSDLVNAITTDPGITARILKLVNSAYFNLDSRIDNIRQAVNLLGMKPVHDLVLATSLADTFAQARDSTNELRASWYFSVRCAVYAHRMAMHMQLPDHERLFVDGLLCDIGHHILNMQLPEQCLAAATIASQKGLALHQIENEIIGFHYADVGAELMQKWNMPASIAEVVRHHIDPQQAEHFQMDAIIVHVARVLASVDNDAISTELVRQKVTAGIWEQSGLRLEDLQELVVQAKTEIETTAGMLMGSKEAA